MNRETLEVLRVLQNFKIDLNITLENGGKSAGDVIELYSVQVCDDINQIAWNLSDCDDKVLSEHFDSLILERWSVTHKRGDDFLVKSQFTVNALNADFINKVINEYMDGFADSIADTMNGYYSRTGKRVAINPHPLGWEVQIK